jgi:Gram-negative bacterial TonB protein C-terminal
MRRFTNHRAIGRFVVFNLITSAFISVPGFGASTSSPQIKTNETDDLARQLLEKFTDEDTKGIVVMDLEPAVGQPGSFGPWVSDQLSASLAAQAKTAEIVDRSKIAPALEAQHLSPPGQEDVKNAVALSKSIGATTVVVGSYGATESGIGISLAAYRVFEYGVAQSTKVMVGMVFGKLPLTQETSAHLNVPLDSLRPKDGIYRPGYGGVSMPSCVKCQITGMHVPDVDIAGMLRAHPQGATVWLQFVVTAEGRTRDITVVQPVGYGFDEQYVKMAENFELKPAVDADNKPVSVLLPFSISFKYK